MPKVLDPYRELRPQYESLVNRLRDLLESLLEDSAIPYHQIDGRAKSVESFREKLFRKTYNDPLSEIKDLAGLRIVTYYHDDVPRVAEMLRREFTADDEHSTDKVADLGVEQFGYRSFHLVCQLDADRANLTEWSPFAGMQFEIQVRSVLQHAWAAVSHKLDYKSDAEVPRALRRQLLRLSALFEIADDEFVAIRDCVTAIAAETRERLERGNLSVPVDLASLRQVVDERVNLASWRSIGEEVGMKPASNPAGSDSGLRRLLAVLGAIGLRRADELVTLLDTHRPAARELLQPLCDESVARGYALRADPLDTIAFTIALAERHRLPLDFEYPNLKREVAAVLRKLIAKPGDENSG